MDSENPYQSPEIATEQHVTAPLPQVKSTLATILFSFQGRIPRHIYWCACLGVWFSLFLVGMFLVAVFGEESPIPNVVVLVLYVPALWIGLAVQVKRWHDRDKSGWWVLINFLPYAGAIWSFIELGCLRGTFGPNSYGPDPIAEFVRTAGFTDDAAVPAIVQARVEETCPWCEASVIPDNESRCPACQRPI